jgi:soluble lytic murein transglycosylase
VTWRRGLAAAVLLLALGASRGRADDFDERMRAARARERLAAARTLPAADAARRYLEERSALPSVADWLTLRAARVTRDSTARAQLYAGLTTPAAKRAVARIEAMLREAAADPAGAARWYTAAGAAVEALRAQLRGATAADSARLRAELGREAAGGGEQGLLAAELLAGFPALGVDERLLVARRLAGGRPTVAARQYALVPDAALTSTDRLRWAGALFGAGRYADAASMAAGLEDTPDAAAAALVQGRAWRKLADTSAALAAFALAAEGDDTLVAVPALLALAELRLARADSAGARSAWLALGERAPGQADAPRALLRAGLVLWDRSDWRAAAEDFDRAAARLTPAIRAVGLQYWSGRAWAAAGDSALARARWSEVARLDSLGYYGMLAAERLQRSPARPAPGSRPVPVDDDLRQAAHRLAVLREMGFADEAERERAWILETAERSPESLVGVARYLHDAAAPNLAIPFARRAVQRGATADAPLYRLLYPLPMAEVVRTEAARGGVPPELLAALVRQESWWDPRATSRAGARGLVQLMPATGRQLARRAGEPFSPEQLYDPVVSLRLGSRFLADQLRRHDGEVRFALAAYNAGPARMKAWRSRAFAADEDRFVEGIPFDETRQYVRNILVGIRLYRGVHDLG